MSSIIRKNFSWLRAIALAAACGLLLSACANAPQIPPAEQPLSRPAMMLMGHKGMEPAAPIFVRIFKEESELEVWKARDDGRFYHYKTYPICNWSGDLGPKLQQGDKQAPEGFYTVASHQMNPNSSFHVAFNLGYPNAFDRAHNRTGDFLMVHGKCRSAGCYAMTDALMEEIYALAREAFRGGQERIEVHAFPFRMTDANMDRYRDHKWAKFWQVLKQGYDHFEMHRIPPNVTVCERRYVVNVHLPESGKIDPLGHCPRFMRPQIEPFVPKPSDEQIALERYVAPGQRTRTASNSQSKMPESSSLSGQPFGLGVASSGYPQSSPSAALGFSQ